MPTAAVPLLASPFKHLFADAPTAAQTFRHLLRDLLRETSYLPDPWLRTYYRSYVLKRFRAYVRTPVPHQATFHADARQNGTIHGAQLFVKPSGKQPDRQHHLFIQARDELRRLARANLGHEGPLWNIMCHAYGRSGERRFALLQRVWKADAPEDPAPPLAVQAHQSTLLTSSDGPRSSGDPEGGRLRHTKKTAEWDMASSESSEGAVAEASPKKLPPIPEIPELPAAINALIRAQPTPRVVEVRSVKPRPTIPELNAWHRPFPVVRKRKLIRTWLQQLKDRILPPLPDEEFLRLRDLVSGRYETVTTPQLDKGMPPIVRTRLYSSPFFQPPRRPVGTIRSEAKGSDQAQISSGRGSLNMPERGPVAKEFEEGKPSAVTLNAETVGRNLVNVREARYLKEKYLRRLYGRMLDMTCRLSKDESGAVVIESGREDPEWVKVHDQFSKHKKSRSLTQGHSTIKEEKKPRSSSVAPRRDKISSGRASRDAWMFRTEDPMDDRVSSMA